MLGCNNEKLKGTNNIQAEQLNKFKSNKEKKAADNEKYETDEY